MIMVFIFCSLRSNLSNQAITTLLNVGGTVPYGAFAGLNSLQTL
jgi:hypothetical protein